MTQQSPATERSERILAAVDEIAGVLEADADTAERDADLTPRQAAAMREAGLFGLWAPEHYGGPQLDPRSTYEVIERVSRIDLSLGWLVGNALGTGNVALPRLPADAADELFRGGPPLMAGALNPPGQGRAVDGGYVVSARLPFGSGSSHAEWFIVPFMEESPPAGALPHIGVVPRDSVQVLNNWNPTGMRATGSHDYALDGVFVPQAFVVELGPDQPLGPAFMGPLYRMPFGAPVPLIGAQSGGAVQAALDWVLDLAQGKVPAYLSGSLRDRPVVQSRLARAQALLSAGRAFALESLDQAWAQANGTASADPGLPATLQLAATFALDAAAEALEHTRRVAGTSAIPHDSFLARTARDMAVLTQHAFFSDSRFESVGKSLLGLESDWLALNL